MGVSQGSICKVKIITSPSLEACHLSYIPAHLDYILFELLKNALIATYKKRKRPEDQDPIITVTLAKNASGLVIRIRDEAGGIPWELIDRVFEYTYSTSDHDNEVDDDDGFDTMTNCDMQTGGAASGFGK